MYILDTDTLTHLHKGNENVKRNLASASDYDFAITIVTKVEILRGRIDFLLKAADGDQLTRAQRFLLETENLLEQLPVVEFDAMAAKKFDELRVSTKFRKIGRSDLLIASLCLTNNAVLVTRNVKHFRKFPDLTVVNWVDT